MALLDGLKLVSVRKLRLPGRDWLEVSVTDCLNSILEPNQTCHCGIGGLCIAGSTDAYQQIARHALHTAAMRAQEQKASITNR